MSSEITFLNIGGTDRKDDSKRVEATRTVSAVGRHTTILRNTGGKYNGVFDVQDIYQMSLDSDFLAGGPFRIIEGRVDGPAVTLRAVDGESDWDELAIIQGWDEAQDMLFQNDFEKFYPDDSQQIKAVLDDLFGVAAVLNSNITYSIPVGATPVVGAVEFREGSSFIGTLNEMFRTAGWIWYVDDSLVLQAGAPGFSASGEILTNTGSGANIIGQIAVDLLERDGDKLYNYVKIYGKNPMFDAWTEKNATNVATTGWTSIPLGQLLDDTTTVRVGSYSQVVYNNNPTNNVLRHVLTLPVFDYTAAAGQWDLSKGEIGAWGFYDNTAGAPGTPGAGGFPANEMAEIRLTDSAGSFASYYGESTRLYVGEWGFMRANLGQKYDNTGAVAADQWSFPTGPGSFDWTDVREIWFQLNRSNLGGPPYPSHFYIDGITLPLAPISIDSDAASIASYRRRPLVLNMPNIRTQNALDEKSSQLLTHHKDTGIDKIQLNVTGNPNLRYAGQSVTITVPELGLSGAVYYMTNINHICEPKVDVSGGYGHDWITQVEAVPTSGVAYDMTRLNTRQLYSPTQVSSRAGTGIRVK